MTLRGTPTDPDARPQVGAAVTVITRPERLEVVPGDEAGTAGAGMTHPRSGRAGHVPRGSDGVSRQD